ncbi:hypothetical protein ACHQM5_000885 [Ranunculus cassubicifolius]
MAAAARAAVRISEGEADARIGYAATDSGKLRLTSLPFKASAATSYAVAAISGVGNVPSQIRVVLRGSRISDTHFPLRHRIPR